MVFLTGVLEVILIAAVEVLVVVVVAGTSRLAATTLAQYFHKLYSLLVVPGVWTTVCKLLFWTCSQGLIWRGDTKRIMCPFLKVSSHDSCILRIIDTIHGHSFFSISTDAGKCTFAVQFASFCFINFFKEVSL